MASNESQTQKLIGLYRSCECLWNPQSPGYLSSSVQEVAWRKITRGMNSGLTPDQVKLQVLALRNYYDAETAAIRQNKMKGHSYQPRHSYYNDLLFLSSVLPEETEESKASFCLSQLNGILEDSIIRGDCNYNNYPKNFSKATVPQCTATLSNKSNDTKPDVTFYKLILEPEKPSPSPEMKNGAGIEKNNPRSTSGKDNARWYPTSYCVPFKRKKTGCRKCDCTDSDSKSSLEFVSCKPMSVYANKCRSCSSMLRSLEQFSECYAKPAVKNIRRDRYVEPGPKLCCQPRPVYIPKVHPSDTGRDRSCCVSNWKRNRNALGRRLRAQLEAEEARKKSCKKKHQCGEEEDEEDEEEEGDEDSTWESDENLSDLCWAQKRRSSSCCYNAKDRRQSGEDQMREGTQHGIPQINNYQPCSCNQQNLDYGRYNPQVPDTGNYGENQQIPESNTYMSNQQMQNPLRSIMDPQGQQIYSNNMYLQMQGAKPTYYQTQQQQQQQQFPAYTMNQPQGTKPAQQYVNTNFMPYQPAMDYGRTAMDQANICNCGMENCKCNQQYAAPAPIQRPQPDVQMCQAPCAGLRPPDLDVRGFTEHVPLVGTYNGQQEEDENRYSYQNKEDRQWQSDDVPRIRPTRKYNPGRYSDNEQDTNRRRSNDYDQMNEDQRQRVSKKSYRADGVTRAGSYEQTEQTAKSRGYYDEGQTRRASRNNYAERNYEEGPATKKQQSMADRDSTDFNYDSSSGLKRRFEETPTRRKPDSQYQRRMDPNVFSRKSTPECRRMRKRKEYVKCKNLDYQHVKPPIKTCSGGQEPKGCTLPADDSQCMSCPPCAPCRQIPRDCSGQPNRNWQEREDRIARKTKPPPRKCDYDDNRKCTNRDRCRPPPEEIVCECESEEEMIPYAKRRNRENRSKRPCQDDKDDTSCSVPKIRPEQGKGIIGCCETYCTNETCPYIARSPPFQEPCCTKRRTKKCYDVERGAKNMSRNQSAARKCPLPRDDTIDYERPKKTCSTPLRPKRKKAPIDCDVCECSSDDNNYDQVKCPRCNRCCVERSARENYKCGPRRSDRNAFGKNIEDDCDCCDDYNAKRCKRKMNDYVECCSCSSESDDCTKMMATCKTMGESPRCSRKCKDCREMECKRPTNKTNSPSRQSKRTDVCESDCEFACNPHKRCDNKLCPSKQEYKSKGTDVYDSDCDCFTEKKQRNNNRKPPPSCCPRPRCGNDQIEQKSENTRYLDPRLEKNTYRRKPIASQMPNCECECNCNEENATLKEKCEDMCTCTCGAPFEPQMTQSLKRNPAGNGSPFDDKVGIEAALKLDTATSPFQGSYKVNIDLPFSEETKIMQAPQCVSLPCKMKKRRSPGPSKNVRSLKHKSTAASPTRSSPPKTQPGVTTKKRTTSSSNGRRAVQGGTRRTTDTSAAANSKLFHDINSASYFICKLQDDDNSQQYLIVVPKEPISRCETRQDDPGQRSWKQLHCQRQSSSFQGVSWVNPASNSVFPSPPFKPLEEISKISSYEMPPGMADTTMGIVKEYLQQTMIAGCPGLRRFFQPVISPPQTMLTTASASAGPKRCHPLELSSNKANAAAALTENRNVLLTNKLQNLSLATDNEEVIVLLPPIAGFRSSKNSVNTDTVEVQRITVRDSDTNINPKPTPTKPLPPKPPTKPKRKTLL